MASGPMCQYSCFGEDVGLVLECASLAPAKRFEEFDLEWMN